MNEPRSPHLEERSMGVTMNHPQGAYHGNDMSGLDLITTAARVRGDGGARISSRITIGVRVVM